jgi:hypothetical protein
MVAFFSTIKFLDGIFIILCRIYFMTYDGPQLKSFRDEFVETEFMIFVVFLEFVALFFLFFGYFRLLAAIICLAGVVKRSKVILVICAIIESISLHVIFGLTFIIYKLKWNRIPISCFLVYNILMIVSIIIYANSSDFDQKPKKQNQVKREFAYA